MMSGGKDLGASVPDQAGRASHGAAKASPPSGDHPSREPNIICPHCGEGLCVDAIAAVGKEQRMSITVHPIKDESMIQAEALCGQVADLDKIMQEIAKQDGGRVRTYVERIGMTEDGGFKFDLAVLPVRPAPPTPKQTEMALAIAMDAREGPNRETGSDGEAATARAARYRPHEGR